MDKNLATVLTLDTITVIIGWFIYLYNVPPNTSLFLFASQTILVLGLISVGVTFMYSFFTAGYNRFLVPAIIILVLGVIIAFFNWFFGGIIVLISLILLIFSIKKEKNQLSLGWIFSGLVILAVLPPIEALLNIGNFRLDNVIILIAIFLIIVGIYISFKKIPYTQTYMGYLLLSLSFFLLPPYHEVFRIKSNGAYGIYDTAIIIISTILYFVFLSAVIFTEHKREGYVSDINRGYSYLNMKDWENAYLTFKSVYDRGYEDANLLNGMGVSLMHMDKFDESENYLKKALKIKDSDELMVNLGNVYCRKGELNKAIGIYEKILKRNSDCYLALNNIGRCLMKKGEFEKAEKYLKKAVELNPDGKEASDNYKQLSEIKNNSIK